MAKKESKFDIVQIVVGSFAAFIWLSVKYAAIAVYNFPKLLLYFFGTGREAGERLKTAARTKRSSAGIPDAEAAAFRSMVPEKTVTGSYEDFEKSFAFWFI
jgi:hypothetical protein